MSAKHHDTLLWGSPAPRHRLWGEGPRSFSEGVAQALGWGLWDEGDERVSERVGDQGGGTVCVCVGGVAQRRREAAKEWT